MTATIEQRQPGIDAYWKAYYERYEDEAWSRFLDFVDDPDEVGCHRWNGVTVDGYGTFAYRGSTVRAHRWAYEATIGPIPDGHEIDHLCRTRDCVNPKHLEVVTPRENVLRGEGLAAKAAARPHCPHGHPYNRENTYIRRHPDGRFKQRECLTCKRRSRQKSRRKSRV